MKIKQSKQLKPIPEAIQMAVEWIDVEGRMSESELREAMRGAIREVVNSRRVRWNEYGWMEMYDARIWQIVDEVLMEN